jgi:hypothetical protein
MNQVKKYDRFRFMNKMILLKIKKKQKFHFKNSKRFLFDVT